MREKIFENTTLSDIEINNLGITLQASSSTTINVTDYILLATPEAVAELTPLITSGDIIVNDGSKNLDTKDALIYISYPIERLTEFQATGVDCGELRNSRKFYCADLSATGSQNLASGPFILNCESIFPGSDADSFDVNVSTGEITVNQTDTYIIDYEFTMFDLGATNQVLLGVLQVDFGSGFISIVGSTSSMTFQTGAQTANKQVLLQLIAGNKVRVQISQFSGSNSAATVQNGSGISIQSVKDEVEDANLSYDCGDINDLSDETFLLIDTGEL